jgi:hypothetical protein
LTGKLGFDSTAWANGTHTFTVQVTDSNGKVSTVATTTVVTSNGPPTVSWSSPAAGTTVHGVFSLAGAAAPDPTGTAFIAKWCITVDGSPLSQDAASANISGFANANSLYYANLDSSGCYSYNNATGSLLTGKLGFDSTAWANGTHTFTVQVTDSNGKVSTVATTTVDVENPLPLIGEITLNQGADSLGAQVSWASSSDGPITVAKCDWAIDGVAYSSQTCENNLSSPSIGLIKAGQHQLSVTLTFTNGDTATAQLTATTKAFVLTAIHTKISLSCPNSIKGNSFKCTAKVANTLGLKGSILVTPQYKTGAKWVSLKGIKVAVGSKYQFTFPNKMPKTQTVRFTSKLQGVPLYSSTYTYYASQTSSGSTVLSRLKKAGSVAWRDYSGPGNGFGPSPDYLYVAPDNSGYACSVYVYVNPYAMSYDVQVGNFPTDNRSWQNFLDPVTGYGIVVEYGSLQSQCGKALQKVFSR